MEETRKNSYQGHLWLIHLMNVSQRLVFSRTLLIAFISIGTCIHLNAQEMSPTFHPVAPDILSSSFVRCFHKDTRGYMWIGTDDGLIRYDASNAFRYTHNPGDITSLPNNSIITFIEGKEGKFWIGTAQGLCIYDRELD